MRARASAVEELEQAGSLEDLTQLDSGSQKDDIDKQLAQMSSDSQVDSELSKIKQELGSGSEQKSLGSSEKGETSGKGQG
jgi:phage shock protein A